MPTPCEEACYDAYIAEVNAAWTQYWADVAACNMVPSCLSQAKATRDARLEKAKLAADLCIENCGGSQ